MLKNAEAAIKDHDCRMHPYMSEEQREDIIKAELDDLTRRKLTIKNKENDKPNKKDKKNKSSKGKKKENSENVSDEEVEEENSDSDGEKSKKEKDGCNIF